MSECFAFLQSSTRFLFPFSTTASVRPRLLRGLDAIGENDQVFLGLLVGIGVPWV